MATTDNILKSYYLVTSQGNMHKGTDHRGLPVDYVDSFIFETTNTKYKKEYADPSTATSHGKQYVTREVENIPKNYKLYSIGRGYKDFENFRVYDDEGNLFTVSLRALRYILKESDSMITNGNEFSYKMVWARYDSALVLIPYEGSIYKEIDIKNSIPPVKDFTIGNVYRTKGGTKRVFVGRKQSINPNTYYTIRLNSPGRNSIETYSLIPHRKGISINFPTKKELINYISTRINTKEIKLYAIDSSKNGYNGKNDLKEITTLIELEDAIVSGLKSINQSRWHSYSQNRDICHLVDKKDIENNYIFVNEDHFKANRASSYVYFDYGTVKPKLYPTSEKPYSDIVVAATFDSLYTYYGIETTIKNLGTF